MKPCDELPDDCPDCPESDWHDAKVDVPEYQVQMGGTPLVEVIICLDGESVTSGFYAYGHWEVLGIRTSRVTHWQYFPDPPEKECWIRDERRRKEKK